MRPVVIVDYDRIPFVCSIGNVRITLDMIIELRTESGDKLIREAVELDGVSSASLMTHDGEATL